MTQRQLLVLATRNAGKTREIRELLKDFAVEIKNLDDFGSIPPVEENGTTFDDNAYKKAAFTAKVLGLPTLADDSGLEVDALGGAPGVHSARYAGPNATDKKNNAKLSREMKGKTNRVATFVCVISVAVPSGVALTYEGRCEGLVAEVPAGENGFGYDPLFYYPPLNRTFAQLSAEEKNQVSHRGKALAQLKKEFDEVLTWIRQRLLDS
ncbi:MAG: XTP/dITP diphosphatase [Desulfobacterales bacterium]|jgi:XTP/dITP diphosphohydrolase|nr:MAG: XTP/dITP diphosphatase [Desulfobacterales bacterium]UCG80736.1 MAG: XTP/dITP diphosphatase [Desulfobacterales bacterium]